MALFFLLFLMVSLPVITDAQQYPYLKLVLQNGQHYQRPRHFTIQGLWPHGIAFCNMNPPFQPSTQVISLLFYFILLFSEMNKKKNISKF